MKNKYIVLPIFVCLLYSKPDTNNVHSVGTDILSLAYNTISITYAYSFYNNKYELWIPAYRYFGPKPVFNTYMIGFSVRRYVKNTNQGFLYGAGCKYLHIESDDNIFDFNIDWIANGVTMDGILGYRWLIRDSVTITPTLMLSLYLGIANGVLPLITPLPWVTIDVSYVL